MGSIVHESQQGFIRRGEQDVRVVKHNGVAPANVAQLGTDAWSKVNRLRDPEDSKQ